MSKRSDAMKRKAKQMAKKNLAKAKVQLVKFKARAKVELKRHARALKLAAQRYRVEFESRERLPTFVVHRDEAPGHPG